MAETQNIKLELYDVNSDTLMVEEFMSGVAGDSPNSSLSKIDRAIGKLEEGSDVEDLKNSKTYKMKLQLSASGNPQITYEEVVE